jgi:hypothetical protein
MSGVKWTVALCKEPKQEASATLFYSSSTTNTHLTPRTEIGHFTMAPSAIPIDVIQPLDIMPTKKCHNEANIKASTAPMSTHLLAEEVKSGLDPLYQIIEQPIGTRRPLRVACLGAGYSGLMMSIVIGQKMKDSNIEFVIYERNSDLGGTWLENRFVKTWRDTLSWW